MPEPSPSSPSPLLKAGKAAKAAAFGFPPVAGWGWCWKTVWPWLQKQAGSWRTNGTWQWPGDGETCLALAGLLLLPILAFALYFVCRVWKEIERDGKIYQDTASKLSRFYIASFDLLGRWWDAMGGWLRSVFARRDFTQRYLRELPQLRSLVDVRGLVQMESNHLELEEVYVELKAAGRTAGQRTSANPVSRELKERAPIWNHLRFLKPGDGLAMIGAPGCGKTTLLKHLMLTYARNRQWRQRVRHRVPFFIELRKLPKLLAKKSPALPALLKTVLEADDDLKALLARMPEDWLAVLLKKGKCLLLWDGLDEVPDAETRKKVSGWLDEQINHTDWRGNLFLVTARPSGYESAPLQHTIGLDVQPFDWEDTRRFIHRWYLANRLIKSRAAKARGKIRALAALDADKLLRRLRDHPRLGAFTSNPLLLTMVCLMHDLGELPGSRSQLYEEICQVHLERWRRRKEADGSGPEIKDSWNAAQKLLVLRPLAHHLMQIGAASEKSQVKDSRRLTTQEMLEVAKTALDHIGVAKDEDSRKSFFIGLHQHSGLWLEWERGQWGFAHLSFQEYLCADRWFAEPATAPVDWVPLFGQSWWRETLLLYASKATDLRPIVCAALDIKTSHSLAFLFALEGETVTLPADFKERIDNELHQALAAKDELLFKPAAEAWLLRQQEMDYARLAEDAEMSSWVSQAEYQLFLNSSDDRSLWPLHIREKWFQSDPRKPALGMTAIAATTYCNWLDERFPEFQHRLPLQTEAAWIGDDTAAVAWIESWELTAIPAGLASKFQRKSSSTRITIGIDLRLARSLAHHIYRHHPASHLTYDFNLVHALAHNLTHNLAVEFALALSRKFAYALNPIRADNVKFFGYKKSDISLDISLDRLLTRPLDLDLDLNHAHTRAHALANILDLEIEPIFNKIALRESWWQESPEAMLAHLTSNQENKLDHQRLRAFLPLLLLWSPGITVFGVLGIYRRFILSCIDVIREINPQELKGEMAIVEDFLRLLIEREEGSIPPLEGIQVVRTRRQ